jgi:hypothetical protein
MGQPKAQASAATVVTTRSPDARPVIVTNGRAPNEMDTQLMEVLAEILADALLADLEAEQEQAPTGATAESPRGIGSRGTPTDTPDAA